MAITRRTALALITSAPLAARAALQTPPARERLARCGGPFTYVLDTDGRVTMSLLEGLGFDGRHAGLGNTDPIPTGVAIELPAVRGALDVIRGGSGTFAVMPGGRLLAWGVNARGDLGITPRAEFEGTGRARNDALTPTPVIEIADVVRLAAGSNHTLAVTSAGLVHAWGYNIAGQLGIGGTPAFNFRTGSQAPHVVPYPVRIAGLTGVVSVAAGGAHSLALMNDGTVRAWGQNRFGQLGDGTTVNRDAPVVVTGIKTAVAIVAGPTISGALLADGTVMAWGQGNAALGRTGFKPDGPHATPGRVEGATGIRALACGESHMLAITNTATVVSWGTDLVGEVGHSRPMPAPVAGLAGVRTVGADVGRSIATLANGTIMVWGNVPRYTRPDGRASGTTSSPRPLAIKGLKNP